MKNQTNPEWLKQATQQSLGTGVFLNKTSNQSKEKVYIENITYSKCLELGEGYVAFKWVPHFIASAQELKNSCLL